MKAAGVTAEYEVHVANGSEIAKETLDRIGALYGVEAAVNGATPRRENVRQDLRGADGADAMYVVLVGDEVAALELVREPRQLSGAP